MYQKTLIREIAEIVAFGLLNGDKPASLIVGHMRAELLGTVRRHGGETAGEEFEREIAATLASATPRVHEDGSL